MEIDEDLARFPASIDDALLAPNTPDVPEAPEVQVRPRSSALDAKTISQFVPPTKAAAAAPLYFQCPACRSTLCVPADRLKAASTAPCGHCSTMITPPAIIAPEEESEENLQKRRFVSGGLLSPK